MVVFAFTPGTVNWIDVTLSTSESPLTFENENLHGNKCAADAIDSTTSFTAVILQTISR